jgi:hypothetical protein
VLLALISWVSALDSVIFQSKDAVKMQCFHKEAPCERRVFSVDVPKSGLYTVILHHDPSSSQVSTRVTANGAWHHELLVPHEDGYGSSSSISVRLNKGINTLEHDNTDVHALEVVGATPLALRGAQLPYTEIEAENAKTNGQVIGPDFAFTHLPSEASMRKAVTLSAGQYVEFTTNDSVNAVSVRYSIPNSPDAHGFDALLSVLVNGNHLTDVTVTSRYSWYYGGYPFSKNPGDGKPHHFYDEVSFWLDKTYPSGTTIRLQHPSSAPRQIVKRTILQSCDETDDQKHDCGFYGINVTQCQDKKCCWKPNPPPNPTHIPDCYFPTNNPPGPPTPTPPSPTPPPPTPPPAPGDTPITIDLADFYLVGPSNPQPPNSLSVISAGADPTGKTDATQIFVDTINKAKSSGQSVWIGNGTFTITQHVLLDQVTLTGAGPWYTRLHGNRVGLYGNSAPTGSKNVQVHGLSIIGEVKIRDDGDQVNGVGGAYSSSVFGNVWISHTKCGFWLDGPFDGLLITGSFIHDTTADGINFHMGITNSVVEQTICRNTGDDGLAMWSENVPDTKNTFRSNTIYTPVLANNIAIYGGTDNSILSNEVFDTITQGGGLHVGNRFGSRPLAGTTTIQNNRVVRAGCLDPNWNFGVGAIWFYALDSAMNGDIQVTNNVIEQSPYESFHFIGSTVDNVVIDTVTVTNVGSFVFQFQSAGSAKVSNLVATGVGYYGQYNCGVQIKITDGGGNTGWNTTHCGWPPAAEKVFILNK